MTKSLLQKLLFLFLLFFTCAAVSAQSIQDPFVNRSRLFAHADIEQAWQSAVEKNKPLLVMFTSDHCAYCQKMLSETYGHPLIRRLLTSKAETVLAHAEDYDVLIKRLGIRGFPTTLLVSPQGEVLDVMEGYVDPQEFAKRVNPLLAKRTVRANDAVVNFVETKAVER